MRDTIRIKKKSETHYEIRRTLSETVNRANLEERKRKLDMQIETVEDQLDTLRRNRAALEKALESGFGQTDKEFEESVPVGGDQ